jgi:hypothetical protein
VHLTCAGRESAAAVRVGNLMTMWERQQKTLLFIISDFKRIQFLQVYTRRYNLKEFVRKVCRNFGLFFVFWFSVLNCFCDKIGFRFQYLFFGILKIGGLIGICGFLASHRNTVEINRFHFAHEDRDINLLAKNRSSSRAYLLFWGQRVVEHLTRNHFYFV